jgi:hypothetical protein
MDEQGLTLIEVLIASVITLVLFLALMQAALLSVEVNAGMRGIASSDDFDNLLNSDPDPFPVDAECPPEFADPPISNVGILFERNIRNVQDFNFCTNRTCVELGGDGDCATFDAGVDIRQINITVGWVWREEDYIHRISTIVRRP